MGSGRPSTASLTPRAGLGATHRVREQSSYADASDDCLSGKPAVSVVPVHLGERTIPRPRRMQGLLRSEPGARGAGRTGAMHVPALFRRVLARARPLLAFTIYARES
jgi:hypothetical protein